MSRIHETADGGDGGDAFGVTEDKQLSVPGQSEEGSCFGGGDGGVLARRRRRVTRRGGSPVRKSSRNVAEGTTTGVETEPSKAVKRRRRMISKEEEEAVPVRSLPPEVMEMILGKLESLNDLQTCSRAAPVLDKLLQPRKTSYLFSEVLVHIIPHLNSKDILTFRQVCRSWRDAVNGFMDTRPSRLPYNDAFYHSQMVSRLDRIRQGTTLLSTFDPQVTLRCTLPILSSLQTTYTSLSYPPTGNPFPSRALRLLLHLDNPMNFRAVRAQFSNLLQFLTQFGPHVWHLSVRAPRGSPMIWMLSYLFAIRFLQRCPNLRSFSLTIPGAFNLTPEMERLLANAVTSQPPPQLEHLHTLEIMQRFRTPAQIARMYLTPYLTQVTKLTISNWSGTYPDQLDNLKELEVYNLLDNATLQELGGLKAPALEKLHLVFNFRTVKPSLLLRTLNGFGSLRNLDLDWIGTGMRRPCIRRIGPPPNFRKMPGVHSVRMRNSWSVNYAFLQWFPGLKYLFLHEWIPNNGQPISQGPGRWVRERIGANEAVQIHKYLYDRDGDGMQRSNVWTNFPELRTIRMCKCREPTQEQMAWDGVGPIRTPERCGQVWERGQHFYLK